MSVEEIHLTVDPVKGINMPAYTRENLTSDTEEKRYLSERYFYLAAVETPTEDSKELGFLLGSLMSNHLEKLNSRKIQRSQITYDSLDEVINSEIRNHNNKKIEYTGNIAEAREALKSLKGKKHSEETRGANLLSTLIVLIITLAFVALTVAVYKQMLNPLYFLVSFFSTHQTFGVVLALLFVLVFLIRFRGYWLLGVALPVAFYIFMIMVGDSIMQNPALGCKILAAITAVPTVIMLIISLIFLAASITYKKPTQADLDENVELQNVYDSLFRELSEYAAGMIQALDNAKSVYEREVRASRDDRGRPSDSQNIFLNGLQERISGIQPGDIDDIFKFLKRYYEQATNV
jgi:hypothetical protein